MVGGFMRLLPTALLVVLGATTPARSDVVIFAQKSAQANIPTGYKYRIEDEGMTLVLVSTAVAGAELRVTFHSLGAYIAQATSIGKSFVKDAAEQRNKQPLVVPGNDGLAFVDVEELSSEEGEAALHTRGLMGLDDAYVVFSLSMPEKLADTPAARELLADGLLRLLGAIVSR